MRNAVVAGLVLLLMACSNILHLPKGTSDEEFTARAPTSPREAPLYLAEIPEIPADEMPEPPQGADFSLLDETLEIGEAEELELIVGIPDPPLDYTFPAFSEPDLLPAEPGLDQGEGEALWDPSLPGKDGDSSIAMVEPYFQDQDPSREEGVDGEPEFDIPIIINKKVERFITYYQTRGRRVFRRWLRRSKRYIPLMKKLLREEGLPEDLVIIPMPIPGGRPWVSGSSGTTRASGMA
jgi:hypothetical protein